MSVDTSTEAVERLHKRLENVEVAEMQGDNLAVTLCSYFCNGEYDNDNDNDNCWSDAALAGCAATIGAIQEHYAPTLRALAAERDALAAKRDVLADERDALLAALREVGRLADEALTASDTVDRLAWIEEIALAAPRPEGGA